MLNQIAEMLGMLKKKINTAGVITICLWQSTGLIIGIREPTPLSWHSKTPIVIPFVARNSLTNLYRCIYWVSLTHVHVCICDSWVDPKFKMFRGERGSGRNDPGANGKVGETTRGRNDSGANGEVGETTQGRAGKWAKRPGFRNRIQSVTRIVPDACLVNCASSCIVVTKKDEFDCSCYCRHDIIQIIIESGSVI